jgi:hypothetical protein
LRATGRLTARRYTSLAFASRAGCVFGTYPGPAAPAVV